MCPVKRAGLLCREVARNAHQRGKLAECQSERGPERVICNGVSNPETTLHGLQNSHSWRPSWRTTPGSA